MSAPSVYSEFLKRHKGLLVLFVIVVVVLAYGFWPKAVKVEVTRVIKGPMTVTIDEEGKTRVIDRFIISAPVSAYMRRFHLRVGDHVTKGDVVVELEPLRSTVLDPRTEAEARARVSAAKASLESAEAKAKVAVADLALAQKDYKRKQKLYRSKLISLAELDVAKAQLRRTSATLRSSQFAVRVAVFELKGAQTTLKYSAAGNGSKARNVKLKAPVSGQILKIHHQSEGVVSSGKALLEIGDPAALEVVIDVLSADAVRLKSGTKVYFKRWGGRETLDGVVRKVEPVGYTKVSALGVEEQRVLIIADITSPRSLWMRLGDGYTVDASFVVWRGDNILQVPSSAVFRYQGQWSLFVIRDGRAVLTKVSTGRRSGLMVELTSKLAVGSIVVKHPDDKISDGTRVKPAH